GAVPVVVDAVIAFDFTAPRCGQARGVVAVDGAVPVVVDAVVAGPFEAGALAVRVVAVRASVPIVVDAVGAGLLRAMGLAPALQGRAVDASIARVVHVVVAILTGLHAEGVGTSEAPA